MLAQSTGRRGGVRGSGLSAHAGSPGGLVRGEGERGFGQEDRVLGTSTNEVSLGVNILGASSPRGEADGVVT